MDRLPMPAFGPLAGLRVVFSGIEIAGPFAGQMFAEWGAEVIWIENVAWADTIRVQPNYPQLSRRNLHALSLNIFKDEGREAFLKLMETTDIFIEASKGPAFARRGITDEVLSSYIFLLIFYKFLLFHNMLSLGYQNAVLLNNKFILNTSIFFVA